MPPPRGRKAVVAVEFSKTVKITIELEEGTVMDAAHLLEDLLTTLADQVGTRIHPAYGLVKLRVEAP